MLFQLVERDGKKKLEQVFVKSEQSWRGATSPGAFQLTGNGTTMESHVWRRPAMTERCR